MPSLVRLLGGQPEPASGGDLPDGVLERGGRDMVALIGTLVERATRFNGDAAAGRHPAPLTRL
jgi:hypothetical protein